MKMCDCVNGGQCKRKEVCVGLCELDNLMMCMHLTNCCLVCVRKRCKMGNTTSHNHENVGLVFFLFFFCLFTSLLPCMPLKTKKGKKTCSFVCFFSDYPFVSTSFV